MMDYYTPMEILFRNGNNVKQKKKHQYYMVKSRQ